MRKKRLTQMTHLHGCSCKLPKMDLDRLLSNLGFTNEAPRGKMLLGPGDDAGAIMVNDNLAYITHTDFFTPIVDDPYLYGKISACNAASDVFAKGAADNLGFLIIMALPLQVSSETAESILRGMTDFITSMDGVILGGHTIINPWPVVGAAVTATIHPASIIKNSTCQPGDTLILTKPLGTQPITAAMRLSRRQRKILGGLVTEEQLKDAYEFAVDSMAKSNREAARGMLKIGVNAATDVTGFGILGQAELMASRSIVNIEIDMLPVFPYALILAETFGFGLREGRGAETSGGLLISVSSKKAEALIDALKQNGCESYAVGRVLHGQGTASISNKCKIIEAKR